MKKDITDTIMNEIEDKKVQPLPKLVFLIKNNLLLLGCFLVLVIGILGFSINLTFLSRLDLEVFNQLTLKIQLFLFLIPLLWFSLIAFSIAILFYGFRNTDKGYKIETKTLILSIIALFVLFGTIGWAVESKYQFAQSLVNVSVIRDISDPRYLVWNNPDSGLLAGEIVSVKDDGVAVVDINSKDWEVDTSNATVARKVSLEKGESIKIIGSKTSENTFKATKVMPWGQGRMGCMQQSGCGMRSIR